MQTKCKFILYKEVLNWTKIKIVFINNANSILFDTIVLTFPSSEKNRNWILHQRSSFGRKESERNHRS